MKKNLIITCIVCLCIAFVVPVKAQKSEKQLKKEEKTRNKRAKKEAKRLTKLGYYQAAGAPSLVDVLKKSWSYEFKTNKDGSPKYIVAEGVAVAETQDAVLTHATAMAKIKIAGEVGTKVADLVKDNRGSVQLNTKDATTVNKIIAKAQTFVSEELGRLITLSTLYRNINGNKVEVSIRIAYDSKVAYEVGKNIVRRKLEEETDLLDEELDKLMKERYN